MTDRRQLSNDKLVALLIEKERALQTECEAHREQLRQNDIALQTKDQLIAALTRERDEYRLAYDRLMHERFRNRSERYIDNPDQLRLDLGDTDEAADAALGLGEAVEELQTIPEHTRRTRRKPQRDERLPEHLERYEVVAEASDSVKHCETHGERTLLPESMWDKTERLEFERPRLRVRVTKYPKYVCPGQPDCGVGSPQRPTGIVEGDRYDSSIATEIITGKFAYHLPLYRLQDYFAGCGWTPSRGTQCNILENSLFLVEPLLNHFRRTLKTDGWIGCDDTGLTLLYPKSLPTFDLTDPKQRRIHEVFTAALAENKSSINAKMWAYRGVTVKLNVFDFTVSRHRDGPELFFSDFIGTLQGDCWQGFEAITVASDGRMMRSACNAHARRKFENSVGYPADRQQWLQWYQQLYDIEDRAKALEVAERLEMRQSEAKPIWDTICQWLEDIERRTTNVILPKSDLAKAINYVRNHFVELQRYLDDGMLPIDNNETEQLMRQVALGRKNWMFAGSVAGGERNAAFLTLASSAIRNNLDVWAYVKDCLDQLLAGSTNYDALLPWNWAEAHPESIRQYRAAERRDRDSRKRATRAERRKRQQELDAKRPR